MKRLVAGVLFLSCVAQAHTFLTLNLHGYHPMGEADRYWESRAGSLRAADPSPFYFRLDELEAGNRRRLDRLGSDLARLRADILFFQEVAAGVPASSRDCREFLQVEPKPSSAEASSENTAVRLWHRLAEKGAPYQLLLACRGNRGWVTDSKTFAQERIVTKTSNGSKKVIFDFGSNPYPDGLLVEGTAIALKTGWELLGHQAQWIEVNEKHDRFFAQLAAIRPPGSADWMLVANIHGGHKVAHFEQAVALRSAILRYLLAAEFEGRFLGMLIGGDFNARLFREKRIDSEITTVGWEVAAPGYYDLRLLLGTAPWRERLRDELTQLNASTSYKPWATILDPKEARLRIEDSIDRFIEFQKDWESSDSARTGTLRLREGFEQLKEGGFCAPLPGWEGKCELNDRIDLVFWDERWSAKAGFIAYPENDWTSLKGVSDHPGLVLEFE